MADTSSIGPSWPPSATSASRIKGIDTRGVIASGDRLEELLGDLERLSQQLDPQGCDRLSLRAVFAQDLIETEVARLTPWVEAVMPIDDGRRLALVYCGQNAASRPSVPADVARALKHVKIARDLEARSGSEILKRVEDGGYRLRILSRAERVEDEGVHQAMATLYRRFGWSFEETLQILANRESLIAVASISTSSSSLTSEEDGAGAEPIVCAGIAELSHLKLGDGIELRIAEFTEAATLREHQGRGLYSAVAALLMRELADQSVRGDFLAGEIDLGFGECSGHDLGVLIAARRLGRRFSFEVHEKNNWPFPGFLPQHVPIAGAPRQTRFNDLFPTFLSRQALYRFVES